MKKTLSILVICIWSIVLSAGVAAAAERPRGNVTNQSFSVTKKILWRSVYHDYPVTFYCGATFDHKRIVRFNGYVPKRPGNRARRLEWEHVVPAHAFGQSFAAWRRGDRACVDRKGKPYKGRNCARKASVDFRRMAADMYNLVPAIGELNGLRSNYRFAMIPGEKREFGTCDFEIENRKAKPAPQIRGDIARIYFYMNAAYPGRGIVTKKNRRLFEAWSRQDPVDALECERNRRIEKIQGNPNPFVKAVCREVGF